MNSSSKVDGQHETQIQIQIQMNLLDIKGAIGNADLDEIDNATPELIESLREAKEQFCNEDIIARPDKDDRLPACTRYFQGNKAIISANRSIYDEVELREALSPYLKTAQRANDLLQIYLDEIREISASRENFERLSISQSPTVDGDTIGVLHNLRASAIDLHRLMNYAADVGISNEQAIRLNGAIRLVCRANPGLPVGHNLDKEKPAEAIANVLSLGTQIEYMVRYRFAIEGKDTASWYDADQAQKSLENFNRDVNKIIHGSSQTRQENNNPSLNVQWLKDSPSNRESRHQIIADDLAPRKQRTQIVVSKIRPDP